MHPSSEDRFKEIAVPHFVSGMKVFELGPDNVPSTYFRHLQAAGIEVDWWFCELEGTGTAVYDLAEKRLLLEDPYKIECLDEVFDVVFHGQVLEHVPKPWRFVVETARVLKSGGKMIVINPADWHFHDPQPDCWRAYPEAVRALFEEAGLRCEYSEFFSYADGTADTVSVGVKVGPPLIEVVRKCASTLPASPDSSGAT
jgi:SAM-dependent methyltransferase